VEVEICSLQGGRMKFDFCTELSVSVNVDDIFQQISRAFDNEPHLLKVSASELTESFDQKLSMVVMLGGKPVGHTRLLKLTEGDSSSGEWYELGSTWVHPDYRNHQLNAQMYEKFLPRHEDKNVLATTTNVASLAVGRKIELVTIPRRSLPENVWVASCTCSAEKTGVDENSGCLLAYSEVQQCKGPCWFRVTKSTAERLGLI